MRISHRAQVMQESPIRKLAPLAQEAKRAGKRVYHLNIGQPDLPTPSEFFQAVMNFQGKVLEYGPSDGLPVLREAMVAYFARYGIHLFPEEILITNGGSEAISFAFDLVADHGDEIIVLEPFYTNYNGYAQRADIRLVPVRSRAEEGFRLPPDQELQKAISPRTRAMLICSPNNPTGSVFTPEELERIAYFVAKNDLFLISDEVYKEFIYDGSRHISVLELPSIAERAIVVDSISKRFSACGARVGAIISRNREIMAACLKLAQARLCPPTLEQIGAAAAYRLGEEYFAAVRQEYEKRRDTLFAKLTEDPTIILRKPRGAFYMVVKMLGVEDSDDFAAWLLTDFSLDGETVMVAPASGFYASPGLGRDEVRVAYILETEKLERAARIFLQGLKAYRVLKQAMVAQ